MTKNSNTKLFLMILFCLCFLGSTISIYPAASQNEESYPLFNQLDLYCSFFIHENDLPELKISGAERESEKILFTDGDVIYINQGLKHGLQEDQVFMALEVGKNIKKIGHLMFMRGRVRLVTIEEHLSIGKVEESCGAVRIGNLLVPFEEKPGLMGKDEGYDLHLRAEEGTSGSFLYMENENVQIRRDHRAIIDLGHKDGIVLGQQILIFRQDKKDTPLKAIGNSIVIDVREQSSTIKILSSRDAITMEDKVRLHTPHP